MRLHVPTSRTTLNAFATGVNSEFFRCPLDFSENVLILSSKTTKGCRAKEPLMLGKLFLTFTIFTITELALLIYIGGIIGFWWTLFMIIATAFCGSHLMRLEGMRALRRIQADLNRGALPKDALLDGLAVMIAGAFMITPGVLTDALGFMLLLPPTRIIFKKLWMRYLGKKLKEMQQNQRRYEEHVQYRFYTANPNDPFGHGGPDPFSQGQQGPFGPTGNSPTPHDESDVIDITPVQ